MTQLAPCPSCRRHVRLMEDACPFCQAQLDQGFAAARAPLNRGLKRAALFALSLSAGTAAACGGSDDDKDDTSQASEQGNPPSGQPAPMPPTDDGASEGMTRPPTDDSTPAPGEMDPDPMDPVIPPDPDQMDPDVMDPDVMGPKEVPSAVPLYGAIPAPDDSMTDDSMTDDSMTDDSMTDDSMMGDMGAGGVPGDDPGLGIQPVYGAPIAPDRELVDSDLEDEPAPEQLDLADPRYGEVPETDIEGE